MPEESSKGLRSFTRRRRSRGGGKAHDSDETEKEVSGFDGLHCTDDPSQLNVCSHVLVYLNGETHTDPSHSAALHRQLDEIIKAKHHLILVHENRADFNGKSFKSIIDGTPKGLVRDESGAKRLYQVSKHVRRSMTYDSTSLLTRSSPLTLTRSSPLPLTRSLPCLYTATSTST